MGPRLGISAVQYKPKSVAIRELSLVSRQSDPRLCHEPYYVVGAARLCSLVSAPPSAKSRDCAYPTLSLQPAIHVK